MTVSDLSRRMTAAEENHWMAFYKDTPFPDKRMDVGLAQIAQILFNQNVKKPDRKSLSDFIPFYRKPIKKDKNVDANLLSAFSKFKEKD